MKVRVGAVAGIDRSLPAGELGASFEVAGDGLRVLMVISRPAGAADAGFRMIARPLLERLEAVRGQVDLVVLRPPTLDALAGTLAEAEAAGEPFRVVHFDGHGVLAGRRAAGAGAPGMFQDAAPDRRWLARPQWQLAPQAGIGVYERGPEGLLAAVRVYDDVEAPVKPPRRLKLKQTPRSQRDIVKHTGMFYPAGR